MILLLINIKILAGVQIKFFFRIQRIKILEICWVECVFEALLKSTYDIKVLIVVAEWDREILANLLHILLIIKINNLRITLLRWQLIIHIRLVLIPLILLPRISSVRVCRTRPDSEAIPHSIHGSEAKLICELVVINIRKRSITLIIQSF